MRLNGEWGTVNGNVLLALLCFSPRTVDCSLFTQTASVFSRNFCAPSI
jgi:hypothetical protein